jgi:hypothetical protein
MTNRRKMFTPTVATQMNHGASACLTLNSTATTKKNTATVFRTNANPAYCAGNNPSGVLNWSPGGLHNLATRARNLASGLVGFASSMMKALQGTTTCPLPTFAS